ncbi:MAG: rod-binding protein [Lachnospiraceae bacterium]
MNMSLDGLSSLYPPAGGVSQANGLENTLEKDFSDSSDEELMDVCKDFEAYFTEQVFKAMEKMVPKSEEESSQSMSQMTDYFKGQMTQEYAKKATEGNGLGIAQMMYEQMKRNYDI